MMVVPTGHAEVQQLSISWPISAAIVSKEYRRDPLQIVENKGFSPSTMWVAGFLTTSRLAIDRLRSTPPHADARPRLN